MDDIVEREIGLEGLEGLTLPSFWLRLNQEHKRLGIVTDTASRAFRRTAWESVLRNSNIELYLLPEGRDVIPEHEYTDLEDYTFRASAESAERPSASKRKRQDNDDDEAEYPVGDDNIGLDKPRPNTADNSYTPGWIQERASEPTAVNSYGVYTQKDANVRGSCRFLSERKPLIEDIRRTNMTVDAAYKKYGDRLVMVASSSVREKCIGSSKFSKAEWQKLTPQAYCVLEVIVRHRAHGCFLCIYGSTVFGSGVRNLKQVHNYTSILQELGLITKQKGRFKTNAPQQGAYQVLTYMFPTSLSRTVKNEIELYIAQVRKAVAEAPGPGLPLAAIPRLPDFEKDMSNKFRKRIKGFFPDLEIKSVAKDLLQDHHVSLGGDRSGMVSVCRFPATTIPTDTVSKGSTSKGRPPCVIPENLEVTSGAGLNKSLMKATLLTFKANKERGLSVPDLEEVFVSHKLSKKILDRLMRQLVKSGYVKPSGKFPGKNPAKRYVLVENEEERHNRLASTAANEAMEGPDENHNQAPAPSVTLQDRVLAWTASFGAFDDARFLHAYYTFVDAQYGSVSLSELITELANAVDAGLVRFHLTKKDFVQPGSSAFSTFLSSPSTSQKELEAYFENASFASKVKSYLAPNSKKGEVEKRCSKRRITVYQSKSRILRYRLFHRYLFCLAHESANPPPEGFNDWRSRIRHAQFAKTLKGWVTFDDILRNMPLAVFARLTPLTSPVDDYENVIKNSVEHEATAILPLIEQSSRVLRHILSDRNFVHLLRSCLFCLRQLGLVSFGLSEGFWPDRTELYYIHDELTLSDTMTVPSAHIATGVMDPEIAAQVPDMQISFSSDFDVMNFWQDVGNQIIATKSRTRRKYTSSVSTHMDIALGTRTAIGKKSQQNKLASQYQMKEAMPEVLHQMTPQTLIRPSRPPGNGLALCGFDPIVRLHVRYFWLHAEQSSRNMQNEAGYIPEMDSFQLDHIRAARRRREADRTLDKPKFKKVRVKTDGRAKPGPKRIEPRVFTNSAVKRAFENRSNGQLFRESLPWKMHEKLLMVVYIGARDLLRGLKQKRPAHVAVFPDLMDEYFPDASLRRSRRELEVHLLALQRDDAFIQHSEAIRDIIELDPQAQEIINHSEARRVSKVAWTLSELYEEWRQLVRIGMDNVLPLQKGSRSVRMVPDEDPRGVNNALGPSQREIIRQFVLGNLVMHTIIRGTVDDPRALNVAMRKEDQRVNVGMGFHLNFRGVIVTKKIFERHPDMVVNLGGIGMGPSMRFKEFVKSAKDTWLGVAVNVSQIESMTGEVDPRVAIPFYFDALENCAAEHRWSSAELDKRVVSTSLSSFLEENETLQEISEDDTGADSIKFIAVPGLYVEDNSFLGMSKLVQYEIVDRFEALKKELGARISWSETDDDKLSSLGFDYSETVFDYCLKVKNFVSGKQMTGVSKKAIWDFMDDVVSLPIEEYSSILNILLQRRLIIPAGIEEVLYVSSSHMASWLSRAHTDQMLAFQARPWLSFDGDVLGDVLYSHLQLVLWRICEKSCSSLSALIRHFQPFFFGRNTIEIVEILASFGLVKKVRCDVINDELTMLPITKDSEWMDDGDTEHIYAECKQSVWHSVLGLSFLKELLHVNDEPSSAGSSGNSVKHSVAGSSDPAAEKLENHHLVEQNEEVQETEDIVMAEPAEAGDVLEEDEDDAPDGGEISEDVSEHEDEVEELDADFFAASDGQDTEEEGT